MTPTTPTTEPTQVTAGTNWAWDITDADYPPSDGWTLSYAIRGATAADKLDVEATPDADEAVYQVRVAAASSAISAGLYHWAKFVEDVDGNRYERGRGTLRVLPDFGAADTYQTHEQTVLAVLDAAIEGRLTSDMEQFSIRGRSVTRIPIAELKKLRGEYRVLVRRQMTGGKVVRAVETHFRAP